MTREASTLARARGAETYFRSFSGRLLVLCAACVGIPLLSAYVTGAIHIPHNDDWAFFRILFHLSDTGQIRLLGWNEMMLVGHLALALPLVKLFGHNVAVVNTFEALVSGLGLFVTGVVARRFTTRFGALFVVVIVAAFPGFAGLDTTFMTDNAAFTAQMICVALGLAAFDQKEREREWLLAAALFAGLFAFSIREFAITAPMAVVLGYFVSLRRDGKSPLRAFVALVAVVIPAVILYKLRHTLAGDNSHYFGNNWGLILVPFLSQALFTLSLAVTPALVLARKAGASAVALGGAATTAAVALGIFAIQRTGGNPTCCYNSGGSPFQGNLLTERGPLGNQTLFGDRPVLYPTALWLILMGVAIAAAGVLLALAARRVAAFKLRPASTDPGVATLLALGLSTGAAVVFRAALAGPLFDRYLTIPVACCAILLLKDVEVRPVKAASGAIAVLVAIALLGAVTVSSGHSFDAARWRAGEAAVAAGIPAGDVDAGFEWVGFHYQGVANEPVARRSAPTPPGYMNMFPAAGNCGLAAASPQEGDDFEPVAVIDYHTWLGLSLQHVWLYRYAPGCRAAGLPES